ncbi:MAG: NADP-dependent oxidoreductase [Pseudomonadota bacterium]
MNDRRPDRINRQILFAATPAGLPTAETFALVESPMPEPAPGQILVRHLFLNLSPSARLRMAGDSDYGPGMPIGRPVQGQVIGVVESSRNPAFTVGERLIVNGGWQEYSVTSGHGAERVDPAIPTPSLALGLLGTSGMTAYVGLLDIGMPKPGETVVVSAASGSVGSIAGQIAKTVGCRVVGISGGEAKCSYVVETLGFDACIDHRAAGFAERLAAACPDGVDVSFENVGGEVRDAVWPLLNDFGRVALCGLIASYSDQGGAPGPEWFRILMRRLTVRGFLLRDHAHRREQFLADMQEWHRCGLVQYREDIAEGLEHAPAAFSRLLQGENFGKALVRLADG